jgi:hypothetical protein
MGRTHAGITSISCQGCRFTANAWRQPTCPVGPQRGTNMNSNRVYGAPFCRTTFRLSNRHVAIDSCSRNVSQGFRSINSGIGGSLLRYTTAEKRGQKRSERLAGAISPTNAARRLLPEETLPSVPAVLSVPGIPKWQALADMKSGIRSDA